MSGGGRQRDGGQDDELDGQRGRPPDGAERADGRGAGRRWQHRTASLTATLTPFTFTDDPLSAQSMLIQAVHIVELRAVIDIVRVARASALCLDGSGAHP